MKQYIPARILVYALLLFSLMSISAEPPSSDDPVMKRKFTALGLIWQDVEAEEPGSAARKGLLAEFLTKSGEYLAKLSDGDSTGGQIWTFRAVAAVELDRAEDAKAAGVQMQLLGLDKSTSPMIVQVLAVLERKGWLVDPKVEAVSSEPNPESLDDWRAIYGKSGSTKP